MDKGRVAKAGNLISFLRPDVPAAEQAKWFCPQQADALTQASLARINQLIVAFVYCILGMQVKWADFWAQAARSKCR